MRYDLSGKAGQRLVLVLSQYQKSNDFGYTHSFVLLHSTFHKIELTREWTVKCPGGSPGYSTFGTNPMFALRIPDNCGATVPLR